MVLTVLLHMYIFQCTDLSFTSGIYTIVQLIYMFNTIITYNILISVYLTYSVIYNYTIYCTL